LVANIFDLSNSTYTYCLQPTNFKSPAAQVPQLVSAILSDPKTFNYPLSQESPNVFPLIYEGLTTENPITANRAFFSGIMGNF
jgi:peptide/nickel transport system substrate-binding protein